MAIAMAADGGIGFIHKNLPDRGPGRRGGARSRSTSRRWWAIRSPSSPRRRSRAAVALMREHGISGIPVTQRGKLVGILTNRDLRFEKNLDQRVEAGDDPEARHGARGRRPSRTAKELLHQHRIEKLLVVNEAFELARPHHHQGHREDPAAPQRRQGPAGPAPVRRRGGRRGRTARPASHALLKAGVRRDRHRHRPRPHPRRARRGARHPGQLHEHRAGGRQRGHRRGRRGAVRGRRRRGEGGHRPGLHLHHPGGGRRRRAADHRRRRVRPGGREARRAGHLRRRHQVLRRHRQGARRRGHRA